MKITRRYEFDAGHRIPGHEGKCRNFHGHRYRVEVSCFARVNRESGSPEEQMVMDFATLKDVVVGICAYWDHGFLVYKGDELAIAALSCLGTKHHTVVLDFIPTAEGMAEYIVGKMMEAVGKVVDGVAVRVYETPNCWADAQRGDCSNADD